MAGSSWAGKEWSMDRFSKTRPDTVLDVGAGLGTYSELFRPIHSGREWTAVEIHEPYVEWFNLQEKYDRILIQDICRWPAGSWGLVILGDVVEHLVMDAGRWLIGSAVGAANNVLVSIPIGEYLQGAWEGNIHETHLSTWEHVDVVRAFEAVDLPGYLESSVTPCPETGHLIGVYWWTRQEQLLEV